MVDHDWVAHRLHLLEFLEHPVYPSSYDDPTGWIRMRMGACYVKHVDRQPAGGLMYWAACRECQYVDLFFMGSLNKGEHCVACTENKLYGNVVYDALDAQLDNKKPIMYPLRRQKEACAAVLLDGLDAVRAIALDEAGKAQELDDSDDQATGSA